MYLKKLKGCNSLERPLNIDDLAPRLEAN